MSYVVEALCDARRFGSAARKQIAMYLANKAGDDGAGIWCSKHTIARHTELSLATVKRTIREFLAEGILEETGMLRACDHGHTVIYRIALEVVAELESLRPKKGSAATGVTVNPVQSEPPTGVRVNPRPGSGRPPNNPRNNSKKPPTRAGAEEAADSDMEIIWAAYPADRRRDRASCRHHLAAALAEVTLDELNAATKAYAAESAGFTRSKVSFLDNWLRDGRWRRHVDEAREQARASGAALRTSGEVVLANTATWVKSRSSICQHLTEAQVVAAVEHGLISRADAKTVGFMT